MNYKMKENNINEKQRWLDGLVIATFHASQ